LSVVLAGGDCRADAQRNRAKLREVAEQVFAEGGLGVSAGEIARRACWEIRGDVTASTS